MANKKAKKDNKNLIIGVIAGIVAIVVVIVLAVALLSRGNKLDDSFFVSDGTKYVATLDGSEVGFSEEEGIMPLKVHLVYFYSGDTVTGVKSYYEFADEDIAKKAFEMMKEEDSEGAGNYELNGKYVILAEDSSKYEGMTADDAKEQIEFIESVYKASSDIVVEDDVDVEVTDGDADVDVELIEE